MNLDQAHSYLIIVLIRLECFAALRKVVSAAEASRERACKRTAGANVTFCGEELLAERVWKAFGGRRLQA